MLRKKKSEPVRRRLSEDADESVAFQRSRTITGSASSNVRASAENRGELKSQRIREHESRLVKRRIGMFIGVLIVITLAIGALFSQYIGGFSNVTFGGGTIMTQPDAKTYQKMAEQYFAKKPLERFAFAFHADKFSAYMQDAAPEVKTATIQQKPFVGSELTVTLRDPVAVWQVGDQKSYVDDSGAVFAKNYFGEPGVSISDESGATVDGGAITSSRFLKFVGQVISGVSSAGGGTVNRVVIPSGAVRYVEFYVVDRAYPIKAQIDRDATSQTSDIVNMLKYLDERQISPAYIDARVEGKGYWR